MNMYISTNIYNPYELEEAFELLEKSGDKNIGLELFVEWQDEKFEEAIKKNIEKFKEYNISMHGPYYNTEHSAEKGTSDYERTVGFFKKSLKLSKEINSKYIVYHHLERVMERLKDKIAAYHIHNNNGYNDNHDRIRNGNLDFDEFLKCYKKYTPDADLVIEYGKQCYDDNEGIIEDINYIKKYLT